MAEKVSKSGAKVFTEICLTNDYMYGAKGHRTRHIREIVLFLEYVFDNI
jgi:hypothetical protein